MYSEVSKFFHNSTDCDPHQQQLFLREAARIEMNQPTLKVTQAVEIKEEEGIISNYKDSRAFKTLLRR
jgi:hypothetical protein